MVLLGVLLILFYGSHSLLASAAAKRWAEANFGSMRWYRLAYSVISLAFLLVITLQIIRLAQQPLLIVPDWLFWIGTVLVIVGAAFSLAMVTRYGAAGFIGLAEERHSGLMRRGINGRIRHPIYTGIILAGIGLAMVHSTPAVLLAVAITFIYLPIGISLEERKLIGQFGREYICYRAEVPAILPRIFKIPPAAEGKMEDA